MKTKAVTAATVLLLLPLLLALTGCSAESSPNPTGTASSPSTLPDVTGETLGEAWSGLQSKNFHVDVIRRVTGSPDDPVDYKGNSGTVGRIYSVDDSDPKPGSQVEYGQKVTLYVGFTPESASPTPTPTSVVTPTLEPSYTPPSSDVTYTVTSDAPIHQVTVGKTLHGSMSMEQFTDQPAAFTKSYHIDRTISRENFDFFNMNAQAGDGASTITCTISINGSQVAKQTSQGAYATVMCSS